MKRFTAVKALLAMILVLVTLWQGSDGVVQISSPFRAERSIIYNGPGKGTAMMWRFLILFPGQVESGEGGKNFKN